MANVVQMPTGRKRKQRLRENRAAEAPTNTAQPTARARLRRCGRYMLISFRMFAWLIAHMTLATASVLLCVIGRIVFFVAKLAFIATALVAIVECLRHWQDMDVFIPLASMTGVLLVAFVIVEALSQALFELQHHTHHRSNQ